MLWGESTAPDGFSNRRRCRSWWHPKLLLATGALLLPSYYSGPAASGMMAVGSRWAAVDSGSTSSRLFATTVSHCSRDCSVRYAAARPLGHL